MESTIATKALDAKQPISPEELRAQLLRPLPQITLRGVLITIAIAFVLWWGLSGVRPSEVNRIYSFFDPFLAMFDLIGRMLPPTFEWARGTETTINIFDRSIEIGWPLIITSVFETIQMAVIGTLAAVIISLPLSLLAAKNVSPHPLIYQTVRMILNTMRSIPELIWALLFVAAVGLGPFTGALALTFGTIGSLSRIFAEAIEQIDPQQVLAVRATGAGRIQTFIYSVFPQALPLLISYSIIFFESNVRHATILGYVGAGGVGYNLFLYMGKSDYDMLLGTVIVLVVAVTIIDRFSNSLRQRFI
jgi:phosphonate transport system permease protein